MAQLTKRQRKEIDRAFYAASRALGYIGNGNTVICKRKEVETTTLDYVRRNGGGCVLYEVNKEIGSDLCGLSDCVESLRSVIVEDDIKRAEASAKRKA